MDFGRYHGDDDDDGDDVSEGPKPVKSGKSRENGNMVSSIKEGEGGDRLRDTARTGLQKGPQKSSDWHAQTGFLPSR